MATTYNRPPVLVREFLRAGTMLGIPTVDIYRVYAAGLGRPSLTATERMQAVYGWLVANIQEGTMNDEWTADPEEICIDAVDEAVQDLQDDIAQGQEDMADRAEEVVDLFEETYGEED